MLPQPVVSFLPNDVAAGPQSRTRLCVHSCEGLRNRRLPLPSKAWG